MALYTNASGVVSSAFKPKKKIASPLSTEISALTQAPKPIAAVPATPIPTVAPKPPMQVTSNPGSAIGSAMSNPLVVKPPGAAPTPISSGMPVVGANGIQSPAPAPQTTLAVPPAAPSAPVATPKTPAPGASPAPSALAASSLTPMRATTQYSPEQQAILDAKIAATKAATAARKAAADKAAADAAAKASPTALPVDAQAAAQQAAAQQVLEQTAAPGAGNETAPEPDLSGLQQTLSDSSANGSPPAGAQFFVNGDSGPTIGGNQNIGGGNIGTFAAPDAGAQVQDAQQAAIDQVLGNQPTFTLAPPPPATVTATPDVTTVPPEQQLSPEEQARQDANNKTQEDVYNPPPPAPKTNDELINEAIRGLLEGGKRNTAEEEAFIEGKIRDKTSADLVGQRARFGRAGFASSGALGAMEGDIRTQAQKAATEEILGERARARDEYLKNIQTGIGAEGAQQDREFNNMLKEKIMGTLDEPAKDKAEAEADAKKQYGIDSAKYAADYAKWYSGHFSWEPEPVKPNPADYGL